MTNQPTRMYTLAGDPVPLLRYPCSNCCSFHVEKTLRRFAVACPSVAHSGALDMIQQWRFMPIEPKIVARVCAGMKAFRSM